MSKRLSTQLQFCERNSISKATFYKLIRTGQLRAVKIGRKTAVTDQDEDDWRASLPTIKPRRDSHDVAA